TPERSPGCVRLESLTYANQCPCVAICSEYWSGVFSADAAFGATLTFSIHPLPNGSADTSDGSTPRSLFTAVTSPLTGAYKSDTAFTDSISPKVWPAFTESPTFGLRSTKTTSVSCSTANDVMPIVQTSPSIFVHSWV